MKKDLVFIVLFFYVIALVRPITPAVQDLLAHTFWKMEHLATVHYENGKYHVHKELRDQSSKEESRFPSNSSIKTVKDISLHLKKDLDTSPLFANCYILSFADPSMDHEELFLQKNNPPPEFTVIL